MARDVSFVTNKLADKERSLLSPLGQYRQRHIKPSEGKRIAKRKRRASAAVSTKLVKSERPPAPELASFIDVGLVAIARNLEKLAAGQQEGTSKDDNTTANSSSPYSVIFVARSGQPSAFNCQLPQMVAVASKSSPCEPQTRLVGYSRPCAENLSACLGIPRASAVGIRVGAPMSKALVDYVQQHVSPVRVAWLEEAEKAVYRSTQLKIDEKMVPAKKSGKA
ncbi:hypothetical protein CTA1_12813 [Colletotrichum tanaceti]|uniref:Uncharacterized protein n=1 Tax=Colletotrichum tanaceti TaxID=1306861 RepID=A0A4U6X850_9PEZI|nr:hypothetical protein CTA1_12813 [Colletotrichum tanaceti]